MATIKTKVVELLDLHNISYRLQLHTEPALTVEALVAQRWAKEEMVKSILLRERTKPHRFVMTCVLGNTHLDPKAVRNYLPDDWKRLTFATGEEIREVTGYIQGAVAPLCLPEDIPVIFDEAIANCQNVNINSGDPLVGLELKAEDLMRLSRARLAPIAKRS